MGQRKVDGFDARLVFLALAGIAEAPNPVVGLEFEFSLQRVHKGAKHVQQHALAAFGDDLEYIHVHQRGEHDGLGAVHDTGVIDLSDHLMRLVNRIDEGQANMPGFDFKLGQDGVAKGLGGDAGTVRNIKNSSVGHKGPWMVLQALALSVLAGASDIVSGFATYNVCRHFDFPHALS